MPLRHFASLLKSGLSRVARRAGSSFQSGDQANPAHRRFLLNERGAVAIYFGLSAIVFISVTGLAVDAARGYLIKARLSQAIDAAALAGGKALQTEQDPNYNKVKTDAKAFFRANFPDGAMGATVPDPSVVVDNSGATVSVNATATIPTTLMSLLGFQTMTVASSAKVARAVTGLDVVFSFDNSGSMGDTISGSKTTKIQQQVQNAQDLVDTLALPFTSGVQQQQVTVKGVNYSLLNIGVVPWNSKVNVKTYVPGTGTPSGSGTWTATGTTFTDPLGHFSGTQHTYTSPISEVPLLYDPTDSSKVPGGWSGCVFARYNGNTDMTDDADLTLGAVTMPNGTQWPGWEPVSKTNDEIGNCNEATWNATVQIGRRRVYNPPSWYYVLPSSNPDQTHDDSCTTCPKVGILPLHSNTGEVKTMISTLTAGGTTNAAQGLFWAWEVLMPGDPFNEAVLNPPFDRAQAIVLMTDGQSHGGNGDAYHGWFGAGDQSSSTTDFGNNLDLLVYNSDCSTTTKKVDNNLGNRLLQVATKIKGCDKKLGPGQGPIKIYVIQYQQAGEQDLTDLLSQVATKPDKPYFFAANNEDALKDAFNEIGASLSALRIVQ